MLVAEARQRAALNLYSRDRQAFNGSLEVAELFAVQAALVLGFSRTIQKLDNALGSRTVIGQAVGIVMERYGVDQTKAFEYLTRLSQNSNTKLRTVADNLVNQVATDEAELRHLAVRPQLCAAVSPWLLGRFGTADRTHCPRDRRDHPRDVVSLAHVRGARPESQQPLELIGCRHTVGAKVEMHSVLDRLGLGHGHHVDRWPRSIGRPDGDDSVLLLEDPPTKDVAPEVGDQTWLRGVDRDSSYSTGHALILACLAMTRCVES